MRLFIKLFSLPILLLIIIWMVLPVYNEYKIRYLLKKWKKKYRPFPMKKEA